AITAWVEQNKAPDTLIATKYHGDDPRQPVERVRPLCAFPAHAEWNGGGDRNSPADYRCVAPPAK
ncbi:MAG TPA: tannase/feruloyl esterase family alpha/beta hydrolase, partial [Rhizomicrobium sp.]|nr:tannase/feruloyl esterase family alpha/beta hydrolase [Rhizomicrobium sp.]